MCDALDLCITVFGKEQNMITRKTCPLVVTDFIFTKVSLLREEKRG